jgi:hypothetical protein
MKQSIALLAVCASAALAQSSIRETTFKGRPGWVLTNGLMQVTMHASGGHFAEIRLISPDPKKNLNPMLTPPEDQPSGGGYMGHIGCFPSYGPASPAEAAAGLTGHGEARNADWRLIESEERPAGITAWFAAELPKTQYRMERAVHIPAGKRYMRVEERAENLALFDRPINWMQHATVGPPFAEQGKTTFDASATRGEIGTGRGERQSLKPSSPVEWPRGTSIDGAAVDLRVSQTRPNTGTYYPLRLDPARSEQFFTLFHPDYRLLLGYIFPAECYPWIADWQDQNPRTGRTARGIEFGSSPFDEGLRKSVERAAMYGAPTYRWIAGREKLKTEFTVFVQEIPEGFSGVKDARIVDGDVVVTPR